MAVIKAVNGGKSLSRGLNYVENKAETTSGIDCSDDKKQAYEQMMATKEAFRKTGGRQYKHYIQSFKPGEINAEQAHEIGREWAKENFPGHEIYIGTHTDRDHIHNHFIINSVNYETGQKIHLNSKHLQTVKASCNSICIREGLSVPDKSAERGEIREYKMDKYKTFEKAIAGEIRSYVADTAQALDKALEKSEGKGYEAFTQEMKKEGYKVELRGQKHITFTDIEGHKVRGANLSKTFNDDRYTRESIENALARQIRKGEIENEIGRPQEIGTSRIPKDDYKCQDGIPVARQQSSQNSRKEGPASRGVSERSGSVAGNRARLDALKQRARGNDKENIRNGGIKPRLKSRDDEFER